MYESKDSIALQDVCLLAKNGNHIAQQLLKQHYNMKVYTNEELLVINKERLKNGRSLQEAIEMLPNKQTNERKEV